MKRTSVDGIGNWMLIDRSGRERGKSLNGELHAFCGKCGLRFASSSHKFCPQCGAGRGKVASGSGSKITQHDSGDQRLIDWFLASCGSINQSFDVGMTILESLSMRLVFEFPDGHILSVAHEDGFCLSHLNKELSAGHLAEYLECAVKRVGKFERFANGWVWPSHDLSEIESQIRRLEDNFGKAEVVLPLAGLAQDLVELGFDEHLDINVSDPDDLGVDFHRHVFDLIKAIATLQPPTQRRVSLSGESGYLPEFCSYSRLERFVSYLTDELGWGERANGGTSVEATNAEDSYWFYDDDEFFDGIGHRLGKVCAYAYANTKSELEDFERAAAKTGMHLKIEKSELFGWEVEVT